MKIFRAASFPHHRRAWLAWLIVLAGVALAGLWLWRTPPGAGWVLRLGLLAVLAGLASWLGYHLWLVHGLQYQLDRDALRIVTMTGTVIVPLPDITTMSSSATPAAPPRRWWHWPALWLQPQQQPLIMASLPTSDCLQLSTRHQGDILISPAAPQAFMQAVRHRQQLGPARRLQPRYEIVPWRQHWLWQQRRAQLWIGSAAVLLLAATLYLVWRFPSLPADLALHFNAAGEPDRFAPRRAVFILPLIMFFIWLSNSILGMLIHHRQRWAATMLWAGSLVLQGVGFLVLYRILP